MKRPAADDIRILPFLHTLLLLAGAAGWVHHCWTRTSLRIPGAVPTDRAGPLVGLEDVLAILNACLTDVALGFCSLLLFGFGTGVYVRRFQTWIDARGSGDAVAYGGADLKDRALAANTNPSREG